MPLSTKDLFIIGVGGLFCAELGILLYVVRERKAAIRLSIEDFSTITARPDQPSSIPLPVPARRYRVGDHYGIHVYQDHRPVATFFDSNEAVAFVNAMNALVTD